MGGRNDEQGKCMGLGGKNEEKGEKGKKNKAKGRIIPPPKKIPPFGCKIDFLGRGGGNNMIHLHNIYVIII